MSTVPFDQSDLSFADRVRRPRPGVDAHLAAVRAALQDGRLAMPEWAETAGVSVAVAERWAEERPIQESYEARLWCAAVTTQVPGWDAPGQALIVGDPTSEEQRRRARSASRRATWTGGHSSLADQGAGDEPDTPDSPKIDRS